METVMNTINLYLSAYKKSYIKSVAVLEALNIATIIMTPFSLAAILPMLLNQDEETRKSVYKQIKLLLIGLGFCFTAVPLIIVSRLKYISLTIAMTSEMAEAAFGQQISIDGKEATEENVEAYLKGLAH
jgi:hypothetical protein